MVRQTFPRSSVKRICCTLLIVGVLPRLMSGCAAQTAPSFDTQYSFSVLKKQCDFGPRPPGAEAHEKTRDYLFTELSKHSKAVVLQKFTHIRSGETFEMANIIAGFGDTKQPGILLCAHWDTRPTADEELEAADRKRPILGANDGASGVAVLLELARMFHQRPPAVPVTIVLFDGEDFGPTVKDMLLGSKHFAANLSDKRAFRYGILLDMVGDKDLKIYREANSQSKAGSVVDKIWSAARKLGHDRVFRDELKYQVTDDHVPLIEAGIPCADVIDFDYAYWHTLEDTVDKCSAESLRMVGETIARVVYSEGP